MKQQITRLSPHQNAKVAAVLWAVTSLVFVVPMFLMFVFTTPPQARAHDPFFEYFFLLFPFIYLILGYVLTLIASAVYNAFFKYIGGFEFESREPQA